MHHIGMSTAPSLYTDLAYDPLTSFKTIGLVTEVPMTIVGRSDLPPTTLAELKDYVTANAATINYANAGVGAASHLCGRIIEDVWGVDVTEVEYEGTAPALEDLVGKQVDFMCDQTTNTTKQITSGAVKAYGITSAESERCAPGRPDDGRGRIARHLDHGLARALRPCRTPPEVVAALTAALKVALADAAVVSKFAGLGTTPVSADQATPEAHTKKLTEQIEVWRPLLTGG